MSDLLEDQRIHYIVKDYRRMYDAYWKMKKIIELQDKIIKDKSAEILILDSKLKSLKDTPCRLSQDVRVALSDVDSQLRSVVAKATKAFDNITKARSLLKEQNII